MWEQLIYTAVDEVVDGKEISGWHVKERSQGLDDEQVAYLLSLVRPALDSIEPLDILPTAEEIRRADRRMTQFPTPWGTALIQTAPAGRDVVGRPNTCTHVLLDMSDDHVPMVDLIRYWRAEFWITPFGQDAVRDAVLPSERSIRVGEVDDESVQQFLSEPGRLDTLVSLISALSLVLVSKRTGDVAGPQTVVLPVSSVEESVLWIAAVGGLTFPLSVRSIAWSTLERMNNSFAVDGLVGRGLDLACVPSSDVEDVGTRDSRLLVVRSTVSQPESLDANWARLAAAISSLDAYNEVVEGIRDIAAELVDQSFFSLAWPLAMAEACDEGILTPLESVSPGYLTDIINEELVSCESQAWEQSHYLSSIIRGRFVDDGTWSAERWYRFLSALGEDGPVTELMKLLVERYLQAASNDAEWLLSKRAVSSGARRCIADWSCETDVSTLRQVVGDAVSACEQFLREDSPRPLLAAVDALLTDGVLFAKELWDDFVISAVIADGVALRSELHDLSPLPVVRSKIAQYIEQELVKEVSDGVCSLPTKLAFDDAYWLTEGLSFRDNPITQADYLVRRWRITDQPTRETARELTSALTHVSYEVSFNSFDRESFAELLDLDDLQRLGNLAESEFSEVAASVLWRQKPTFPSQRMATWCLTESPIRLGKSPERVITSSAQAVAVLLEQGTSFRVMRSGDAILLSQALNRILNGGRFTEGPLIELVNTLADRIVAFGILQIWGGADGPAIGESWQKKRLMKFRSVESPMWNGLFTHSEVALSPLAKSAFVNLFHVSSEYQYVRAAEELSFDRINENIRLLGIEKRDLWSSGIALMKVFFNHINSQDRHEMWVELAKALPDEEAGRKWLVNNLGSAPKESLMKWAFGGRRMRKEG